MKIQSDSQYLVMDYEMARKANALGNRFEGRLFIDEGRLHFVVEVDVDAGFARVSFRADGQHQVIEMPLAEVATQLAKNSKIILDGMSSADKAGRITQDSDGWYFNTRDGRKGPYPSDDEAAEALEDYISSVKNASSSKGSVRAL